MKSRVGGRGSSSPTYLLARESENPLEVSAQAVLFLSLSVSYNLKHRLYRNYILPPASIRQQCTFKW
jgi:hypothetical protein